MKRKNSSGDESPTKRVKLNVADEMNATQNVDLLSLPVDIHAIIFLKVHTNDACRSRQVCKFLKEVLDNIPDLRWAFLFQSNFGLPEKARPPGGLVWRKQYKYSVSVLKNIVSVEDVTRTRELASDITDQEAEQFKFSDLVDILNKMPEDDRKKARQAKSTWAIRVSYYRLAHHLIQHKIFENDAIFFPITLQQGFKEVLNVLWNEKMYDSASLEAFFSLAVARGSDWLDWAQKFIQAGATGLICVKKALVEDNTDHLEMALKVGANFKIAKEDLIYWASSKNALKLLLDYGAGDSFTGFLHLGISKVTTLFISLVEKGQYDMAELLLLSGKAKGVQQGLEIALKKNEKFAQLILDYLQQ